MSTASEQNKLFNTTCNKIINRCFSQQTTFCYIKCKESRQELLHNHITRDVSGEILNLLTRLIEIYIATGYNINFYYGRTRHLCVANDPMATVHNLVWNIIDGTRFFLMYCPQWHGFATKILSKLRPLLKQLYNLDSQEEVIIGA